MQDRLANPPHSIRDELEALRSVKASGCDHQTQVAFIDQVGQWQSKVLIPLGDADDEPQVGLHEFRQCCFVALLNPFSNGDFFLRRQADGAFDFMKILIDQRIGL